LHHDGSQNEIDIAKVAGKIIQVISAETEVGDAKLTVKPSVGIAVYPKDGETANALMANADTAMYRAKRTREGYAFFSQIAHRDTKPVPPRGVKARASAKDERVQGDDRGAELRAGHMSMPPLTPQT
jgi:GGDEF domain-containing protein